MKREIRASSTNSNFDKKIALSLALIAEYCRELVDILSDYKESAKDVYGNPIFDLDDPYGVKEVPFSSGGDSNG